MTVDISALAAMVRRMDVSATLKSFVVVFAFLFVAQNLAAIFAFLKDVLRYDLIDSENIGILVAQAVTGTVFAFTPLAFIMWDWMARKQWAHLAAITGGLIGGLGFALLGGALGFLGYVILSELDPNDLWAHLIAAGPLVVALVLLVAWMVVRSRRGRKFIGIALIGLVVLFVSALFYAALDGAFEEMEETSAEDWIAMASFVALVVASFWLFTRAVHHRIALSGERPRELMLGAIQRKSFWARLAFLAGLPSSLWHARAPITPEFWAFLLARPLVYAGILVLLGNVNIAANNAAVISIGIGLVVGGHLLFYLGKRLAARRIWNPDNPQDKRDPVLFLRSFEDDQLRFKRPWWDMFGRWNDLWSFRRNADEAMIDEIAQYGPVVALGMPGEDKVPFGAARFYSTHDDWQRIITDTAKRARAIVIGAGDTPGVRWEYELLARENLIDRTLMLFPPTGDDRSAHIKALAAFTQAAAIDAHFDIPENQHPVALLKTDSGTTLLTADEPGGSAYLVAVRGFFQRSRAAHLADKLGL